MQNFSDTEIIQMLGGVTAVARMLEIKAPSVHEWLTVGIPESRLRELAGQIELVSKGQFTRRERWPEKFAFYWPELAEVPANIQQFATESVAVGGAHA